MHLYEIERYSANHPDWEGSFSERLYECNEWNPQEFWKLHRELIELAIYLRGFDNVDKKLVAKLLVIQKSVHSAIAAHYDPNDVVTLSGVTEDELHEYMERFDMAILGVASGEVLSEESFDLVNPLILEN